MFYWLKKKRQPEVISRPLLGGRWGPLDLRVPTERRRFYRNRQAFKSVGTVQSMYSVSMYAPLEMAW